MGKLDNYPDTTWAGDPLAPWNEPDEAEAEAEVIDPEADAATIRDMALAQALYKVVSAEVKTGDEFNLRGRFDAIMRDRYAKMKALGVPPKTIEVNRKAFLAGYESA